MIDGKTLLKDLREILNENVTSTYLNDKISYDYLYKAACEFVSRTNCLTSTQTITTVAEQSAYKLNADFLKLYLMDTQNRFYIKYNDGSINNFICFRDYGTLIYNDNTASVALPDYFTITDVAPVSRFTGTCSSAGALSNGEATLTAADDFTNVSVGDSIHNTTDDSHGIVVYKTSTTQLVTAMFDGTDNDWDLNDAYVITPQARFQLILNPPPSQSGHTITVYYVQKPEPVYSPYRNSYRINSHFKMALVMYAAWLYKYRDREPRFGDAFYTYFNNEVRRASNELNQTLQRKGIRVNFIKRAGRDGY